MTDMNGFHSWDDPGRGGRDDEQPPKFGDLFGAINPRDTTIQIVLSITLGIGAFLAFCVLRPRWTGLYAARKKHQDGSAALPELPNSFFGWIVPLWRITDQQILAAAGLDAYVFLAFFKMAMKFLVLTLMFSLIVITPVHDAFPDEDPIPKKNETDGGGKGKHGEVFGMFLEKNKGKGGGNYTIPYLPPEYYERDYLWMYVAFAYLFTGFAIYLIISETRRVIEVRQEYLGSQTTVTDRTIRLSGIPKHMQDEGKITEFMENLDIGKVESVTLCRNWEELDTAMDRRMDILRRLEEAYTVYLGHRTVERNRETLPLVQPDPPTTRIALDVEEGGENASLMSGSVRRGAAENPRPKAIIRHGFMKLKMRRVDAIDYYEEQLREADAKIMELRQKEFEPVPLAFVTMDSVAACQMTIQAVLDPSPLQLIANQSPTPSDVIWKNTYMTRRSRVLRSWTVTFIIGFLTIFWVFILIPIAGLLSLEAIRKVFPQLADALEAHKNVKSLFTTQIPTLVTSLLMVLVPYLYYALSWCQGEISKGDIELSSISKNFFFTFFNFFVVFMVLGTASNYFTISQFFEKFGAALKDFSTIASTLALSLQALLSFYVNFIILQGVGLFPFRLLEMGSVSLYPIYLMGAKTPRDYAELVQPPIFTYGFYLPSALLIFIICMVYSVLRQSWHVLLAGLLYFMLGHFVYKYQLLYAMDHRQQSTGRAWGMICDRIFMGLVFFQLTTAGQLLFKKAVYRSFMLLPLLALTVWMNIVYGKTYKPLMQFIALSSVRRGERYSDNPPLVDTTVSPDGSGSGSGSGSDEMMPSSMTSSAVLSANTNPWADNAEFARARANVEAARRFRRRDTASYYHAHGDEEEEGDKLDLHARFVNPSLVVPLRGVWIAKKDRNSSAINGNGRVRERERLNGDADARRMTPVAE